MGIEPGDRVKFAQDKDRPADWYLCKDNENGVVVKKYCKTKAMCAILGTFLRGPNWNFFGPFEYWTPYKVEVLNNVDLNQMFWIKWLDMPLPRATAGAAWYSQLGTVLLREAPGLVILGLYLVALPPLLAVTVFRGMFAKMGFIRYMIMANLMLLMLSLPLKMVLRWTMNLRYIVAIPEISLNF
jgi:hypothetical protein